MRSKLSSNRNSWSLLAPYRPPLPAGRRLSPIPPMLRSKSTVVQNRTGQARPGPGGNYPWTRPEATTDHGVPSRRYRTNGPRDAMATPANVPGSSTG
jgi:hypothetical protein